MVVYHKLLGFLELHKWILKCICILFMYLIFHYNTAGQNKTIISIQLKDTLIDSLNLFLLKEPNIDENRPYITTKSNNNSFVFNFSINKPIYIALGIEINTLPYFLVEPGDSVHITLNKNSATFSGNGAAKFEYSYNAKKRNKAILKLDRLKKGKGTLSNAYSYFYFLDSSKIKELDFLSKYKEKISDVAYMILKADLIGLIDQWKLLIVYSIYSDSSQGSKSFARQLYADHIIKPPLPFVLNDTIAYSLSYWIFQNEKIFVDYCMMKYSSVENYSIKHYYFTADALYNGLIKEKIQMRRMLDEIKKGIDDNLEYCINDFIAHSQNKEYIAILKEKYNYYKDVMAVGKPAFNFNLKNVTGKSIQLKDFKDKVIILDFWFYGCSGCLKLSKAMVPVKEKYKDTSKVVFISISVDTNKERWLKGIKEYHMENEINLYTEGKGEIHPVITSYNIFGYPTLLVIGKQNIFYSINPPDPIVDNGKGLIDLIQDALNK